ncbi:hypothetical protein N7490_007013 [Penicillium lividum]|nr:hypothetical protein N7490_007013 [Penicillium lividum]
MNTDIEQGKYITANYPPFFPNTNTRDENISPFDTTTPNKNLSHWKVISEPQRQRYYHIVEHGLDALKSEATDPNLAILFAHYQVDYHIRQHYLACRGVLTLCRDATDMQSLRKWQWRMNRIDTIPDESQARPKGPRPLGWPNDENLEMAHQVQLWKKSWRARQKHLEEVRARWAVIMEERRRQRELLLAKQASTFTVRLYFWGELCELRELERKMYPETVRLGRSTQSLGF